MKVDGPRDEHYEVDEVDFPKPVVSQKRGSVYCPYRAWLMSRGFMTNPDDHLYCGKMDCWKRHCHQEFHGMEPKVSWTLGVFCRAFVN